jgi:CMP-N-acetylneuraminic acid synthetase
MKILILITARAGSKRIAKKNKKLLGKKPLIFWTLKVAKKIKNICDILVSTDDSEIAIYSKKNGALVPWLRPKNLSSDKTSSAKVALHAIKWYENKIGRINGLLLLQPTSPFRNIKRINMAIDLFIKKKIESILSISKYKGNQKDFFFVVNKKVQFTSLKSVEKNIYSPNGNFYLLSVNKLKRDKKFFSKGSRTINIISKIESLDIDTKQDWLLAEKYSKNLK